MVISFELGALAEKYSEAEIDNSKSIFTEPSENLKISIV